MKTVTLWNVPLEIAEMSVKALREKASKMLQDGAPTKEVTELLWTIQNWEDAIREEENETLSE